MTASPSAQHEPPEAPEPRPPDEGAADARASGGIGQHLHELLSYARYWLRAEAQIAGAELSAALIAAIGRLAALAALIVTAVVLLLVGCAAGLGEWTGRRWLGNIIVGAVTLACALVATRRRRRADHRRTEQKYADMREEQRRNFGRDVRDRARDIRP